MSNTAAKILINCQDGFNNIERATISLILAVTASKTKETAMFVTAEAIQLCINGNLDNVQAPGYEPIGNLMTDYLANGGKLWLCPACIKAKNLTQEDLVQGAEIAGAPKTMAFLAEGAQLLA